MENSTYAKDKEKLANDLERYAIMADYFNNNKYRTDVNKHVHGVPLYYALLDAPRDSEEAIKLRSKVSDLFFKKYARDDAAFEIERPKQKQDMERYETIIDYFKENRKRINDNRENMENVKGYVLFAGSNYPELKDKAYSLLYSIDDLLREKQ